MSTEKKAAGKRAPAAAEKEAKRRFQKEFEERRRMVCRRCHAVMDDIEPFARDGEFFHPRVFGDKTPNHCKNAGSSFYVDSDPKEVEAFVRKRVRRAASRQGRTVVS